MLFFSIWVRDAIAILATTSVSPCPPCFMVSVTSVMAIARSSSEAEGRGDGGGGVDWIPGVTRATGFVGDDAGATAAGTSAGRRRDARCQRPNAARTRMTPTAPATKMRALPSLPHSTRHAGRRRLGSEDMEL